MSQTRGTIFTAKKISMRTLKKVAFKGKRILNIKKNDNLPQILIVKNIITPDTSPRRKSDYAFKNRVGAHFKTPA